MMWTIALTNLFVLEVADYNYNNRECEVHINCILVWVYMSNVSIHCFFIPTWKPLKCVFNSRQAIIYAILRQSSITIHRYIYYSEHIFNIIASNSVNAYDMLDIYCLLTWLFYQLHPSKHAWSELNSGRNIIIIFKPNCCTSRHTIVDEYDNGARLQWRDTHIADFFSKCTIVFHGPKKDFGAAILGVNGKVYR